MTIDVLTSKNLIKKHFAMIDGQRLLRDDDLVQIDLHDMERPQSVFALQKALMETPPPLSKKRKIMASLRKTLNREIF